MGFDAQNVEQKHTMQTNEMIFGVCVCVPAAKLDRLFLLSISFSVFHFRFLSLKFSDVI